MMTLHPKQNPHPLIEFENITVFRDNNPALDRISITIAEGENVAILGPNGAGKSSLVRTITRELYPVVSDERVVFRIRGRDVWDVFELRSTIGIVSNDLQITFNREMSGREVILSGFFSSVGLFNQEISPAMSGKADAICTFLEIDHLKDRLMTDMSSGEARRFLIGRALVNNPRTLILDEPANSLDLHSLHTFRKTIRKIAQSGTGIILITHNLHDIIPEISRVVLMKEGRIVNDGKKTDLLTGHAIGNLFSVPLEVIESGGYYYAAGY
ncbi:ABC transporter ATP-binding protein [Methanoregula sp.]|uniref:ABC transporter ATP-binding protein n=1 Tax=Methanoregula sp. TaxID=2052170 RepID=UPI003561C7DA